MVHADVLNASSINALSTHLTTKWGAVAALVAAPPPPLAPLMAADALNIDNALAIVEGKPSTMPVELASGSSGTATCVRGMGEIDYVPDGSLDPTQQYVLEFKMGRV